jgi:hypothetical protein
MLAWNPLRTTCAEGMYSNKSADRLNGTAPCQVPSRRQESIF